jgi:hypothetical protein
MYQLRDFTPYRKHCGFFTKIYILMLSLVVVKVFRNLTQITGQNVVSHVEAHRTSSKYCAVN